MATQKQKEAIKKMVENGGVVSRAMRDVGYSEQTAKSPHKLTNSKGYKEAAFDYLKELENQKKETIKRLKKTIPKARFAELSQHLERVTKLIELLGGRPTDRIDSITSLKEIDAELKSINNRLKEQED